MGGPKELIVQRLGRAIPVERRIIAPGDLKRAAVLVPVVVRGEEAGVILTKRAMTVAKHKGQISFPGGVQEARDEDAIATALREAREEIGLDSDRVNVLGVLDDYATATGFLITPVLGVVDAEAALTRDPTEVDEVFEVPLRAFKVPGVHKLVTAEYRGKSYQYHSYTVGDRIVWGATAAILHPLLTGLANPNQ